jgi:hypothetical protein
MRDFTTFRSSAIRYWERRRIAYNLALILPAMFGLGALFVIAALGANICYSFCYALEFVFGIDDAGAAWLRLGRRAALIAGIIFAMALAVLGGRNIALLEYQFRLVTVNDAAPPGQRAPSVVCRCGPLARFQ